MDKDFYNQASASKLGWDPTWFGERFFDDKLVRAIKKWQRSHGLTADGLCGPMTFRRILTERQSNIHEHKPTHNNYSNYIIFFKKRESNINYILPMFIKNIFSVAT